MSQAILKVTKVCDIAVSVERMERTLAKHPGKFLVICSREPGSDLPDIGKRVLVQGTMHHSEFELLCHEEITHAANDATAPEQSIHLFVDGMALKTGARMSELLDQYKAADGFLHISYEAQKTLGVPDRHIEPTMSGRVPQTRKIASERKAEDDFMHMSYRADNTLVAHVQPTECELGQFTDGCVPGNIVYSEILRMDSERVRAALASDHLQVAAVLARQMGSMTDTSMKERMGTMGMTESQSVFFGPLRQDGASFSVTACIVQAEHVKTVLAMGFELISKHDMFFMPLDQAKFGDQAVPTHADFIKAKAFAKFAKLLQELGVSYFLIPIVTFTGRGLCIKYHVPQPELQDGSVNPHFQAHAVWTISLTDSQPPEVIKIGIRKGPYGESVVLALPWNPNARDVCLQEADFSGDWEETKNADFGDAHFQLAPFDTTPCIAESAFGAFVHNPLAPTLEVPTAAAAAAAA